MLTRVQWLSIGLMGIGLAVVQLARSTESKQTANQREQSISLGLTYTIIAAFCSGFAGVYFEKMMKSAPTTGKSINIKPSMWVRNIQLASFSMIIGLLNMIVKSLSMRKSSNDGGNIGSFNIGNSNGTDSTTEQYFLKGFTWAVWGMVINNAIGGLCVAMVIKYADNILKGFACAVATIFAAIACVPLFGFTLKPVFIIGMVVVLISVLLYGGNIQIQNPYWNQEPPICKKIRKGSGSRESIDCSTPSLVVNESNMIHEEQGTTLGPFTKATPFTDRKSAVEDMQEKNTINAAERIGLLSSLTEKI